MGIFETTCEELGCRGRQTRSAETLLTCFLPGLQSASVQEAANKGNRAAITPRSEFRAACCSALLARLGLSLDVNIRQNAPQRQNNNISEEMLRNQTCGDMMWKSNESVVMQLATFLTKAQGATLLSFPFTQDITSGQLPYVGVLDILRECMSFLKAKSQRSQSGNAQQVDSTFVKVKKIITDIEKDIVLLLRHFDAFDELWDWANRHEDFVGVVPKGDERTQHRKSMRECAWLIQVILNDFDQMENPGPKEELDIVSQFEEDATRKRWLGASLAITFLPIDEMPDIIQKQSDWMSDPKSLYYRMLDAITQKLASGSVESLCKDTASLIEELRNCVIEHKYSNSGYGCRFKILKTWLSGEAEESKKGTLFSFAIQDELRLLYQGLQRNMRSAVKIGDNFSTPNVRIELDAAVLYQQPLMRKFLGRSPPKEAAPPVAQRGSNDRAAKKLKTTGSDVDRLTLHPSFSNESNTQIQQSISMEQGVPFYPPNSPSIRMIENNGYSYAAKPPHIHNYPHVRTPPQAGVGVYSRPPYGVVGTTTMMPHGPPVPSLRAPPLPSYPISVPPPVMPPAPATGAAAVAYGAMVYPQSSAPPKPSPPPQSKASQLPEVDSAVKQDKEIDQWSKRMYEEKDLSKPGSVLTNFLDHSGGIALWNQMTSILDRVLKDLGERVVSAICPPDSGDTSDAIRQRHIFQTSLLALVYQSLEAILTLETQRVGTKDHSKLLNNSDFHKSLLAVGAECILQAMHIRKYNNHSEKERLSKRHQLQRRRDIIPFPNVLKLVGVSPFDFCKVSETFIRALWSQAETLVPFGRLKRKCEEESNSDENWIEPLGLPLQMRQHLTICEDMILEKLLWEEAAESTSHHSDSSNRHQGHTNILDSIKAMKSYSNKISSLGRGAIEEKHRSSKTSTLGWPPLALLDDRIMSSDDKRVQMSRITSLLRKEQNELMSSFLSSEEQEVYIKQYKAVSFIFRKIVTFMSRRLLALSIILQLNAFITGQIWITFRDILADQDQGGTLDLLVNRHMDQLLLCTIYGACKIANVQPDVSFRKIIDAYGKLELSRTKEDNHLIIRKIPIVPKNEAPGTTPSSMGNIIHFYNQMFVSKAKMYLVKHQFHAKEQRARSRVCSMDDATRLATLAEVAMSSREVSSDGTVSTSTSEGSQTTKRRQEEESANCIKNDLTDSFSEATHEAKVEALPVKGMIHTISPYAIEGTNIRVGMLKTSEELELMEFREQQRASMTSLTDAESDKEKTTLIMKRQVYQIGYSNPEMLATLNCTVNFPSEMPLMSKAELEEQGIDCPALQ